MCCRRQTSWQRQAADCKRCSDEPVCAQIVFALETFAGCLLRKGYFLGMYFWIDFIATFSMFFDIPLILGATHGAKVA